MSHGAPIRARFAPFAAIAGAAWLLVTGGWWALAFAPLPVDGDWLARARSVCFGTLSNGLPDRWGWMLLVLGPLSMLGFLVAVWGRDLVACGRWLARRPAGIVLLAALTTAGAAGAGGVAARVALASRAAAAFSPATAVEPLPEGYLRGVDPAPELGLVDQRGERLTVASLGGRPAVVLFAYAHCTNVCPMLVATIHRTYASFSALPAAERPRLVVVTLDPWRDTPRSLPTLAAGWGLDRIPGAVVLSGEVAEVQAVWSRWGIEAERDPASGQITHPALVFVVDSSGRLAYRFLDPPAEWLAAAVERAGREPA